MKSAAVRFFERDKELRVLFDEYLSFRWSPVYGYGVGFSVPLAQPYQKGWSGTYRIKPMYDRSWMGFNLNRALRLVNVTGLHKRQDFQYVPSKRAKKRGMLPCTNKPRTRILNKEKYEELPPELSKYFVKVSCTGHVRFGLYFAEEGYTINSSYIELVVTPHMVTHHVVIDSEKSSRIGQLREKIKRDCLWPEYDHFRGVSDYHRYKSKWCKQRQVEKAVKEDQENQINEYYGDQRM